MTVLMLTLVISTIIGAVGIALVFFNPEAAMYLLIAGFLGCTWVLWRLDEI